MSPRRRNGEGSIYWHRAKSLWVAEYRSGGQRFIRYFHLPAGREPREARQWIQEIAVRSRGGFSPEQKITLGQFLDKWLELRESEVAANTFTSYVSACKLFAPLYTKRLDHITPSMLRAHLKDLEEGRSRTTVRNIRAILVNAMNQAVAWQIIATSPMAGVRGPKVDPVDGTKRALPDDDVRAILDAAKGERIDSLLRLAFATGLRIGEVMGLRWEDLDLLSRPPIVTVRRSRGRRGTDTGPTKSRRERRVPLNEAALLSLREQKAQQDRDASHPLWRPTGFIWTRQRTGVPYAYSDIWRPMNRIIDRSGIKFTPHDTRHTFISRVLGNGVPVHVVSAIVGHSSPAMTLNVYAHAVPSDLDRALPSLPSFSP